MTQATHRDLEPLSDEALQRLEDRTASVYTGYALHAKLPVSEQGDTTPRAWELRRERLADAEARWLAIQAEWVRRREAQR